MGPLLHLACQASAAADEDALSILKASYQENVFRSLRQKAAERKLSNLLISHDLPFSLLKGLGLAEQLYDDPNARQSKDVDILIPADRCGQVIRLMNDRGYRYRSYAVKRTKLFELSRQDMDIKLFKDLTFFDPDLSVVIELHSRLFKFEPNGLTDDFNESVKSGPTPSLSNSFYCLYLILHGTLAMWPRLKWLVDLSIMVRKMPVQSRQEMMEIADSFGCEAAVAASIFMAEELFPGSLDDDWQLLLAPFQQDNNLRKLQDLFYECLTASEIIRPSIPLKSFLLSGAADLVFPGKIGLIDTVIKRFVKSLAVRI